MSKCKCDLKTKLVGDGCEACNPALALEHAKETIAGLREELAALKYSNDGFANLCHDMERELAALKDAARALLADLDAHATGSMGETQDALDALVREK